MKIKVLVFISLLLSIGFVLHFSVPGIFFGMKPDFMLSMMFLSILLFPEKQYVLLVGVLTGFLSGITSTFPGGLYLNIIEKPITALVFFSLLLLFKKENISTIFALILTFTGTLLSGGIFLSAAMMVLSLPEEASFLALFISVVAPSAVINTILIGIIYPFCGKLIKKMG